MKRFVILLLTAVLALTMPLSALAAGQIEVTEDISVSDDYDWTRFKGQNVTLNVYNWGEYISNGSDDSVDELETDLDQSKESMYKLSYVIRVSAPDLEIGRASCRERV